MPSFLSGSPFEQPGLFSVGWTTVSLFAQADRFYGHRLGGSTEDHRLIQRQAYAGLLWTKQFYFYVVKQVSIAAPVVSNCSA